MAFREAHGASGKCVALAERKGVSLSELSLDDLRSVRLVQLISRYLRFDCVIINQKVELFFFSR